MINAPSHFLILQLFTLFILFLCWGIVSDFMSNTGMDKKNREMRDVNQIKKYKKIRDFIFSSYDHPALV